jgi:hypothetical protein
MIGVPSGTPSEIGGVAGRRTLSFEAGHVVVSSSTGGGDHSNKGHC